MSKSPTIGNVIREIEMKSRQKPVGNTTRKVSKRAKSSSPHALRKTKSSAQQLTEYKMKSHRSRSVTGRMPRLKMSDDFGRSLRANAIPPSKRTMKNYIYPKMPLDLQREVNEWAGPAYSPSKKRHLNSDILHHAHEKLHDIHFKSGEYEYSKIGFAKRMRKNLDNIRIKIFEAMFDFANYPFRKRQKNEEERVDLSYFYFLQQTKDGPFQCYVGSVEVPFNNDHFQIFFDFHLNTDDNAPQLLFTIIPNDKLSEFKKLSFDEKVHRRLYDGYITTPRGHYIISDLKKQMLFSNRRTFFAKTIDTVLNGQFVPEYIRDFDGEPKEEWVSKYPYRTHDNTVYNAIRQSGTIMHEHFALFFRK